MAKTVSVELTVSEAAMVVGALVSLTEVLAGTALSPGTGVKPSEVIERVAEVSALALRVHRQVVEGQSGEPAPRRKRGRGRPAGLPGAAVDAVN